MRTSDRTKNGFQESHDYQIGESKHDEILRWLYDQIDTNKRVLRKLFGVDDVENIIDLTKTIEFPVCNTGYRGNAVPKGFVDLQVSAWTPIKYSQEELDDIRRRWGEEDYQRSKAEKFYPKPLHAFIEIKTSVNLGETIRQIQYYKTIGGIQTEGKWSVCAPPFPFARILNESNIGFIEYRPESFL